MLGTTGDSAVADDKQHLRVVNDLAGIYIGTLAICHTAVGMLGLAVGHWMEEVLHALAGCVTVTILVNLHQHLYVNVYLCEHLDALFLVTSRILMSIGRVSGVACPLLFIRP